MDKCKSTTGGLYTWCHQLNIRPRFSTDRAQDYIDEAMATFINPFLDYVKAQLEEHGEATVPEKLADLFSAKVFSPKFYSDFPQTAAAIQRISNFCARQEAEGSWFTAGTCVGCRFGID
ncbi:MAG: hypothetical protein JWM68_700 [Verrucomicrobiales bacterium]|nr:hypothetical protein [Verrucomicrobiales bacterium]